METGVRFMADGHTDMPAIMSAEWVAATTVRTLNHEGMPPVIIDGLAHFIVTSAADGRHETQRALFTEKVSLRVVDECLYGPECNDQGVVDLLKKINSHPTPIFASALVERGKRFAEDDNDDMQRRGRSLLGLAATVTERLYGQLKNDDEMPLEQERNFLVNVYAPLIEAQQSADDEEGAKQTAEMLIPHLMSVAKRSSDDQPSPALDKALQEAAYAVDSVDLMLSVSQYLKGKDARSLVRQRIDAVVEASFGEDAGNAPGAQGNLSTILAGLKDAPASSAATA